jgi:hypothetical protein
MSRQHVRGRETNQVLELLTDSRGSTRSRGWIGAENSSREIRKENNENRQSVKRGQVQLTTAMPNEPLERDAAKSAAPLSLVR